MHNTLTLGIDIGSTSLSAAVLNADATIVLKFSTAHGGDIPAALEQLDREMHRSAVTVTGGCAVSGKLSAALRSDMQVDSRLATIRSARQRYPEVRAILLVGGEQFCLICFDADGNYHSVRTNTSCAAGTGGFLDQQAGRLALQGSAQLAGIALQNRDPVPLVATRCSVFAKTDLIHAQQEGYSLSAISEGLCRGMARNIADTLFKGTDLEGPVLFTGGVAFNQAVCREIRQVLPVDIVVDDLGLYQGAIGAALWLMDSPPQQPSTLSCSSELHRMREPDRSTFYPALTLQHSDYPDFCSYRSYRYITSKAESDRSALTVEVDLYREWPSLLDAYLGIDIGSTSTKSVLTTLDGSVLGGFYTRTAGQPLRALQALFESISDAASREECRISIHGSATTGSGRKFIGQLIGADEVMDEISAHARAACQLNPDVDTIIEIGGQDAKFTTLRNGRVNFSVMNNVCAAGTGSFLEEQAKRLGVSIEDYQAHSVSVRAPLVSDRCTVFMERDVNHLLATGHTVDEVLAAAVHAVRENYLHKVAVEKNIGKVIFFQGATARNRALVAAFEQRLGQPILVSRWCHLTGALGAALSLVDSQVISDRFVGLELYRRSIPLRREVCSLCTNHCKLTVPDLEQRSVAFGFLCGRDYGSAQYVNRNSSGFDLLRGRRRAERRARSTCESVSASPAAGEGRSSDQAVIGLPDALFMSDDLAYWRYFFEQLGIATRSSSGLGNAAQRGKALAGAEFCAPMSALFGHAAALLDEVDFLFVPFYLEQKPGANGERRKYCYYSQYVSALIGHGYQQSRIVSPLVASRYSMFHLIGELHRALSVLPDHRPRYHQIAVAVQRAGEFRQRREDALRQLYRDKRSAADRLDVVLLGRPYTVLQSGMNKGIPDILAAMGVRVFYQDMLECDQQSLESIAALLQEINWNYAATILKAAWTAARTPGLYPVMLTSFKCGPDSFVSEYVKRIMDAHDKPYLVLELDDHDSRVGYETRIEAALRAFGNHLEQTNHSDSTSAVRSYGAINPRYLRRPPRDRTLVLPNWDNLAIPLIAAIMSAHGYPAVAMQESEQSIRRSLRWNNGQCIPLNALVEGFECTIRNRGLQPQDSALWVPAGEFSCNIKLFPHHIQGILADYPGLQRAAVYLGNMTFMDLSPLITVNAYLAYMFSGLLRRIACRIRPYERQRGQTDRALAEAMSILHDVFSDNRSNKTQAVGEIIELFDAIPYDQEARRPKVALFGDVYVRDNEVMNQDVIGYIERNGGEVVTMPFHEFTRMTCDVYFRRWGRDGRLGRLLMLKPVMASLATMERWYYRRFEKVIGEPINRFSQNPADILDHFGVRLDHEGESQDNLLKTWYITQQHPDLALFVQLNPAFCCAGLVTEAMSGKIEAVTGVPVLSVTYDGTGGFKNDAILPYLAYPPARRGRSGLAAAPQVTRSSEWPVA